MTILNTCPKVVDSGEHRKLTYEDIVLFSHGFTNPHETVTIDQFEGWQLAVAKDVMKLSGEIDASLNIEMCGPAEDGEEILLVSEEVLLAYKALMYTAMCDATLAHEKAAFYKNISAITAIGLLGVTVAANVPEEIWNTLHKIGIALVPVLG